MDATQSGTITTICLVAYVFMVFGMGHISDKLAARRCSSVLAWRSSSSPFLPSHPNTSQFWWCCWLSWNVRHPDRQRRTLFSYLTQTFPTSVRFTGFAFSFNLANAIFGGTASFIATGLIALTGLSIAPAWYMVGVAASPWSPLIFSLRKHRQTTESHLLPQLRLLPRGSGRIHRPSNPPPT